MLKSPKFLIFFIACYFYSSFYSLTAQTNLSSDKISQFEKAKKEENWEKATEAIGEILEFYQKNGKWDSLIIYNQKFSELGILSGNLEQEIKGGIDALNVKKFFESDKDEFIEAEKKILNKIDTTRLNDDFVSGLFQVKANIYLNGYILDTAAQIGKDAVRFADKGKDPTQRTLSRLLQSKILQYSNLNGEAIKYLIEAESILNKEDIKDVIQIRLFQEFGRICIRIEDFEKAEGYLIKAKNIAESNNYKTFKADVELNFARLYRSQKKYNESLEALDRALTYFSKKGTKERIKDGLISRAYVYYHTKRHRLFDETIDSILSITTKTSDELKILSALNAVDRNNLYYAKSIIDEFKGRKEISVKLIKGFTKLEYKYLEANNKPLAALTKFKEYKIITDSINRTKQALKTIRIESEFNRKQQDLEINSLTVLTTAQDKALSIRNIALILGGIMLVILGILLFSLYRLFVKNQENQKELARQNKLITEALLQNQILIKEIHHRVKNNLQVISSLLSMQERKVTDLGTKDALKSSKSRVQSMSILHQNLYTGDNLKDIDVEDYMNKLIKNIIDIYNLDQSVKFNIAIDSIVMDIDVLVPLGLISNELICNALKHAFEGKDSGQIDVSLKSEDDQVVLNVADNGIGVKGSELPQKEGSIGARLIQSFTRKLGGELIVDNSKGTSISIVFDKSKLDI